MRRIATLAALAVPTLLAAGIGAPAAMAADDCPNAAVRAQQQAQHLPNCMAYEKVTPASKGGARPMPSRTINANGEGVLYELNAGVEDAESFVNGLYRADRTSAGPWKSKGLAPGFDGAQLPNVLDSAALWSASSDLSRQVLGMSYNLNANDQGFEIPWVQMGSTDLYRREVDGSFTWLAPDPTEVDTAGAAVTFADASDDLERVVLQTTRSFDARVGGSDVPHLYVWSAGSGTTLVSVLPDGSPAPAVAAVRTTTLAHVPPARTFGVSADGRRIAFTVGTRLYVRFDADDPERAVTREAAVGPTGEECTSAMESPYRALSADGRKLVFFCAAPETPGALAGGLYVRDLDGGAQAVQRVGDAVGVADFLGGTADLSRFYYSEGVATSRLVRVTDGVSRVVGGSSSRMSPRDAGTSIDGEYLVFGETVDLGVTPPGEDATQPHVYLYSAPTDELTCASCRRDGKPTIVADQGLDRAVNPVSTAGSVVFRSSSPLVPEDTNGVADAYAWIDGHAVLLSSGTDRAASGVFGSSEDGSSLFFVTADALVRDDQDGGASDLYVARKNGGVLVPEPPASCASACQDPGSRASGPPRIATGESLPGGNLVEDEQSASRATVTLATSAKVKGSRATVRVKVSGAGSIRVSGSGLRQATVKAKKAGTYKLTVRLSVNGAKQQRSRGRLATRVTARFTPKSGASVSARKSVTFTATTKGGR